MRILKTILPHLTIALAVTLTVVVIVNVYNPMMGFLVGKPFQVLVILEVLCSLATAICLIVKSSPKKDQPRGRYER